MDISKDKLALKLLPDDKLQELLCSLESDRLSAMEVYGQADPHVQYMTLLLDAVCGELIRRDQNLKPFVQFANGSQMAFDLRKALTQPTEYRTEREKFMGVNKIVTPIVIEAPDSYNKLMCLGDGSLGLDN